MHTPVITLYTRLLRLFYLFSLRLLLPPRSSSTSTLRLVTVPLTNGLGHTVRLFSVPYLEPWCKDPFFPRWENSRSRCVKVVSMGVGVPVQCVRPVGIWCLYGPYLLFDRSNPDYLHGSQTWWNFDQTHIRLDHWLRRRLYFFLIFVTDYPRIIFGVEHTEETPASEEWIWMSRSQWHPSLILICMKGPSQQLTQLVYSESNRVTGRLCAPYLFTLERKERKRKVCASQNSERYVIPEEVKGCP